jgi:hypothetical protein
MFITDRDLLMLEPNLFRDVGWLGQRLFDGAGGISGTTLTISPSGGVNLESAGVSAGHVVVVGGLPLEVLARTAATTATVSKLRADPDGAAIPPGNVSGVSAAVWTLRPQIAVAHEQILRLLGIEPGDTAPLPGQLTEAQIVRPRSLWLLEALLTLNLVYASAAALSGGDSPMTMRAEMYRQRSAAERSRAVAYIDTNGDGTADVARYVGLAVMGRV